MAKSYLVTGGTGFLGSALVRRLVKEGHRVRVIDNNWRGAKSKLGDVIKDVEFIEADIRNADAVRKACRKIDAICHLAYINGTEFFYSMPDLVLDVGVTGMLNVIHGGIKEKVPELIVASSSEVYQWPPRIPTDESVPLVVPDPLNPRYSYGGGKIISELLTVNFGRKYFKRAVIFRPHNVFGPNMGFEHVIPQFILRMNKLSKKAGRSISFPIQGTGRETRAFIYINDFIDGLMKVVYHGKHLNIYHIGTMDEISMKSLAVKIGRLFGKSIVLKPTQIQQGSVSRRCPDNSKLRRLGFSAKTDFDQALRDTADWYIQHSNRKN